VGIVRYYMRVLRVAFRPSFSITQDCIFGAILRVGAVVFLAPRLGMSIDVHSWGDWLAALSGWKIAAVTFGSIAAIRLLCAPYWMHSEVEGKLRKATQRDQVRARLQEFYSRLHALQSRPFPRDTPEEKFEAWVQEVNKWEQSTKEWVAANLGEAAVRRLFDFSSLMSVSLIGRFNDRNGKILPRLGCVTKNLTSLIESGAWDRPNDA